MEPGFAVGEELARDAVGAWHRAERDGRRLTLRILRADLAGREDARQLFLEEVRRVGGLRHPALVAVYAADARARRPWMLTDPVDGPTLEAFLAAQGPQPPAAALAFARRVCDALGLLEQRGQVHVDVRPARVLRTGGGWRLWTFREVRAADELGPRKGSRPPDAAWAPPERAAAHPAPWRAPAHLAWSVGALLGAVLGLGPPADAAGVPRPPADPGDAALAALLRALLDPDPARRPAGAAAVARRLAPGAPGSSH